MPKFVFKLQSLLDVKIQTENQLKNELGKAIRNLEREKSILEQAECHKEECIEQLNSILEQGGAIEKFREYNGYIGFLNHRIRQQKENVNNAKHHVDKYREQLVKIVKEKKMLEKLREKRYRNFISDNLRDEQRLNDEIVNFKQHNKSIGEKDGQGN